MRGALAPLLVGLCCILVLGAAGGAMDGAIETDPDDVLSTDLLSLPYEDTAATAGEDLRSALEDGLQSEADEQEPSPEPEPADGEPDQEAGSQDAEPSEDQDPGGPSESEQSDGGASAGGQPDQPPEEEEPSLLERLLEWLQAMLAAVLSILPLLLVLLGLGVLVAHRGLLGRWFGGAGGEPATATDGHTIPPITPTNPLEQAWVDMLAAVDLDIDHDRSLTTREWAEAAVAAGADRDAVERLTRQFEEVRFRGREPTEAEIEQATTDLRRIRRGG